MKTLRQLCAASMLVLTLSLSALAGDMSTTIVQPPPLANATAAGQLSTTSTANSAVIENGEASIIDSMTETALNLLQSVLSLL